MPEKEIKDTKKQKKPAAKKNSSVSRKARHRITSAVLIALVLAGVVILNVIASALTERYSALTADITSAGTYNLTDQTEKILSGLKKKVSIIFLAERKTYESFDTYYKQLTNLADNMVKDSGGFVNVQYVDIVSNPNFVNDYPDDNLQTSDVIVRCGEKYNVLNKEDLFNFELMDNSYQYITSSKAEAALDTAIVKVTSDRNDKFVILTDNTGDTETGYTYLSKLLGANKSCHAL